MLNSRLNHNLFPKQLSPLILMNGSRELDVGTIDVNVELMSITESQNITIDEPVDSIVNPSGPCDVTMTLDVVRWCGWSHVNRGRRKPWLIADVKVRRGT